MDEVTQIFQFNFDLGVKVDQTINQDFDHQHVR